MVWLILAPAPLPFPSRQNLKKDLEGGMKTNIQIKNYTGNVKASDLKKGECGQFEIEINIRRAGK